MTWKLKTLKNGGVALVCVVSLAGAAIDAQKQANDLSHENDFGSFVLQVETTATSGVNVNVEMGQDLYTGHTFPIPRQTAKHKSGLFVTDVRGGTWFRST